MREIYIKLPIFLFVITFAILAVDVKLVSSDLLRAVAILNPPFEIITVNPNGSRVYSGPGEKYAHWLGQRLNRTIEIVYPSQEALKLRSVEAGIDLVVQGEADFTVSGYFPTLERLQKLDPATFFVWEEGYRMVVPKPEDEHRLFAFVKPFQMAVWLLLFATTVVAGLVMSFFARLYARSFKHQSEIRRHVGILELFGSYTMYNINVLTSHGDYLRDSKYASFALLVGFWSLGVAILVYGYSCIVASSLTLPLMKPAVNSLEDLVAREDISLLLRSDMYPGMLIMNLSDAPLHKTLKQRVLQQPESLVHNPASHDKLLLTGKYASPLVDTFVRFFIGSVYKKERKCRFKPSSPLQSIPKNYFYQFQRKGDTFVTRLVSLGVMQLWETGLTRFWVKQTQLKADECYATGSSRRAAKQKGIKLVDVSSAFFILGAGFALAAAAFFFEVTLRICALKNCFNFKACLTFFRT